jgi:uncharacterized membrane protein/nitrite reductase/ring-hydroxylating ferredoxin subunit
MRSRANIKSHPLHPILVCFPIAFFTGTFIFDLLAVYTEDLSFQNTGLMLCFSGILGAVIAAIPGIIDYAYTVPPESSAKKRATKHGLLNTCMLLVFIGSAVMRKEHFGWPVILLDLAGIILMTIAGWLGGTLVHRNQIGVDTRYAKSGKWKEKVIRSSGNKVVVADQEDLQVDQMMLLKINDKRIVLARSESGYMAFDDRCTHRGGSLAAGTMICGTVQCPWHGSQFKCETGEVLSGPAKEKINTYPVSHENGKIVLMI